MEGHYVLNLHKSCHLEGEVLVAPTAQGGRLAVGETPVDTACSWDLQVERECLGEAPLEEVLRLDLPFGG